MVSQRPQDTVRQICDIFPTFQEWWLDDSRPSEDGLVDGVYYEWSHHEVMREFLGYFSRNQAAFTDKQLRQFGAWIRDAISRPGDLENAVSTCFLEHMHQVRIERTLRPYIKA